MPFVSPTGQLIYTYSTNELTSAQETSLRADMTALQTQRNIVFVDVDNPGSVTIPAGHATDITIDSTAVAPTEITYSIPSDMSVTDADNLRAYLETQESEGHVIFTHDQSGTGSNHVTFDIAVADGGGVVPGTSSSANTVTLGSNVDLSNGLSGDEPSIIDNAVLNALGQPAGSTYATAFPNTVPAATSIDGTNISFGTNDISGNNYTDALQEAVQNANADNTDITIDGTALNTLDFDELPAHDGNEVIISGPSSGRSVDLSAVEGDVTFNSSPDSTAADANITNTVDGNEVQVSGRIDRFTSGSGDTTFHGDRTGDQQIFTQSGDDTITLVDGTNTVVTRAGNDVISISGGTNTIATGSGDDTVHIRSTGTPSHTTISDFSSDDTLSLDDGLSIVSQTPSASGDDRVLTLSDGSTVTFTNRDTDIPDSQIDSSSHRDQAIGDDGGLGLSMGSIIIGVLTAGGLSLGLALANQRSAKADMKGRMLEKVQEAFERQKRAGVPEGERGLNKNVSQAYEDAGLSKIISDYTKQSKRIWGVAGLIFGFGAAAVAATIFLPVTTIGLLIGGAASMMVGAITGAVFSSIAGGAAERTASKEANKMLENPANWRGIDHHRIARERARESRLQEKVLGFSAAELEPRREAPPVALPGDEVNKWGHKVTAPTAPAVSSGPSGGR